VTTGRSLILVVDDDEFMRGAMVAVLEADGYAVISAWTAAQALDRLRTGAIKPSLILLDFMMPGMTGADFRAAQLEDTALATIPVVFVSAFPHTLDALQSGPLRAVAVLQKPVDARDLLAVVGRSCHSPEPPAA
jgi:CheY-like chemotaxis protein